MRTTAAGLVGFILLFAVADALGHGGAWRGPSGGVPPGLRQPHDAEPPPPPPAPHGDPDGTTTPGETTDPGTPTTPRDGHDVSGSGGGAPPSLGPSAPSRSKTASKAFGFDHWRFWWAYNNDDIRDLKEHLRRRGPASSSGMRYTGGADADNRRAPLALTRNAVRTVIVPALEERLRDPREHQDVQGGCLVALGKVGDASHIPLFRAALHDRLRDGRNRPIKLGGQARESAALALGLLRGLDEPARAAVRGICLEAIADPRLRTRERAWAAVSLGLQRDLEAVGPMWELLRERHGNDAVPAGILVGLGLMGDGGGALPAELQRVRVALDEAFLTRDLAGHKGISERLQAFVGYALTKLGDPASLRTMLRVLRRRRFGNIAKRSAAIAAGVLGGRCRDPRARDGAVRDLIRFIRKSGDATGVHFATIGLSRIGTPEAIRALLGYADKGRYGQRPFAALGLGTWVFRRRRAGALDPDLEREITAKLASLSQKRGDADLTAAFMLARGLAGDRTAVRPLIDIVASRTRDPALRGSCCVALGLLGDTRTEVPQALRLALGERRSEDLRRDAATGLGLLHDAQAVRLLLDELRGARSMTVQGQLVSALGTIGDRDALRPLVEILRNPRKGVVTRAMAAIGLGLIGDTRDLPELSRVAKDYNDRASVGDLDELLSIL